MLWIKEVERVDSVDDFKSSPSIRGYTHFPIFLDAGCEDCVCSEQDHPEFLLQEKGKGQSGGTESSERGSFPSWKTDRLHDLRLLLVYDAHDTVLNYADLFSVTLHGDYMQEFDTRWDEVLLSISQILSDDILESLHKLTIRESTQLKTVLELYDMDASEDIDTQLS